MSKQKPAPEKYRICLSQMEQGMEKTTYKFLEVESSKIEHIDALLAKAKGAKP